MMNNETQETKFIAVYGSLRKGFGNHRLLENSTYIKKTKVEIPFKMISLGGYPGLINDTNTNTVVVELYEVDSQTYKNVERLEGYPSFYTKYNVDIKNFDKPVEIYVLNESSGGRYHSSSAHIEDWAIYRGVL